MNTSTLSSSPSTTLKASVFLQWLSSGWQLFKIAPFKLFAFLLAVMVVSGLFQILPAPIGVLMSKWVGAGLMTLVWPLLHVMSQQKQFSIKALGAHYSWMKLPVLALILMLPFAVQLLSAYLLLGGGGIELLLFGQLTNVSLMHVASIFAIAAPIVTIFAFVPACLLLENKSVLASLRKGLTMTIKAWRPMFWLCAASAVMLFLAPFTFVLSAILLGPLIVCIQYAAYKQTATTYKEI